MAILECPTRADLAAYDYVISLDGTNYGLSFRFNQRTQQWFLGLNDAFKNSIVAPVPLIVGWPLFDRFVAEAIPPGRLFAFDTSGNNQDPGRFDLGDSVRLYYEESGS